MTTFRVSKDRDNPYVMLDKFSLNDASISLKAKGLLAYLLSKPNDWVVKEHDLIAHCRDGRDSVRAAIRELEHAGYIVRGERRRDEKGRMYEREYEVRERPSLVDSLSLKRLSDSPTLGKPSLDKTRSMRQFFARMTPAERKAWAAARADRLEDEADGLDLEATREIVRLRRVAGGKD
jgi:hypothetical protein